MSGRGVGSAEVAQNVLPQDHLDFAGPVGKAEVTNWEDSMKTSRLSAVICAGALAALFPAGGARAPAQKKRGDLKDRRKTPCAQLVLDEPPSGAPPRVPPA